MGSLNSGSVVTPSAPQPLLSLAIGEEGSDDSCDIPPIVSTGKRNFASDRYSKRQAVENLSVL